MLCEGNTMHDMNLEKYRSKIQTAYKASPFTKGIFPEPEDAVKRFESRYAPIPAEYRWLLLNFGGCYLAEPWIDLCQRPPAQVRRILTDRDGVEVRQHVIALIFIRQLHPVFDGPQVRAQCQFTAGLNAGEDEFVIQK